VAAVPTLTVAMPARNTERCIGEAITSVLRQTGVDLELIVVDDGSTDGTAAVVESFDDPRLRLIRNATSRGISYCHNLVLDQSRSPYIAHVDSDDLILPGILAALVAKLESSPRLGQVHCFHFDVDANGHTTREAFRARRRLLLDARRADFDYKWQLMVLGMVANCLRTYRRSALETVGRFDESLRYGEDFEMTVRLIDKFDIAAVPELSYCRRVHETNITRLRFAPFRFWLQRYRLLRRLKRSGAVRFLHQPEYRLGRAMLTGLSHILRISNPRLAVQWWLGSRGGVRGIVARAIRPTAESLYYWAVEHFSWWPLTWLRRFRPARRATGNRIAYYLWRFPVISETFIRRELAALVAQGFEVSIFADEPIDIEFADAQARDLLASTRFLTPGTPAELAAFRRYFFRKNPVTYLNVMLYVLFHRYDYWKTLGEDRALFQHAVYLAGTLKDAAISHLHSPWADRSAFVAIVAARLLGVPCSVQARAHELHRTARRYALREKFQEADFVVTNCRYNEAIIRSIVKESAPSRIHTIYEGVDLTHFEPRRSGWNLAGPLRILCVARLIEEKGLDYLLRACSILRDGGTEYQCEIIGGTEVPLYADHLVSLQKLHRALDLESCVRFRGAQPFSEVRAAYRQADVFVLPCVVASNGGRDITPNSLIEAMAMQLPVVSTRLAAIPEIIDDGVDGILVPPNDAAALAAAVTTLAADAALRERLGRNARRRIEARFDVTQNINRFAAVLRGLAS
jgi:glycosyltransferase involved in cell wall biosynthesis